MNKSLTVNTQTANLGNRMTTHGCSVICPSESWRIDVATRTPDCMEQREVTLITIMLPGGLKFECTAQSLLFLHSKAKNAKEELMRFAGTGFDSTEREGEVLDTITEVNTVIDMFSKQ